MARTAIRARITSTMSRTANRKGAAPSGAIESQLAYVLGAMARLPGEGPLDRPLREIAQGIVDGLVQLLSVSGCQLHVVDAFAGHTLQRLAGSPLGETPERPAGDATTRSFRERRVVSALDGGLVLAVPLLGSDRPLGVLELRRARGLWTRQDMRLVRLFADQAAVALEMARLAMESRQRRRTAEAVALMAHATSRSFDVSTLGREIVATLLLVLGCARATLFELIDGEARLVAVARAGGVELDDDVAGLELGPVEAQALRDRRLVATSDFLAGPIRPGAEHAPRSEVPIRAVLAIPLLEDDAPIGVLSIGNRAPRVFEREEIEVFRTAADLAAVALERARLHAQAAEAVRVRERVRIANELHDTLGQLAFSVGLKLDWCLHRTAAASSVHPKLEEIRYDIGLMMAQIRQLIGHLSPESLAGATFSDRIDRIVRDFRELTATSVDLTVRGDETGLSPEAADVLQKTLQEALVNIAKHARARGARVHIELAEASASIEVSDDGVGLAAPGADAAGARPGHFGLRQMRERFEGAGGRFEIVGAPGAGVSVRGTVPLRPGHA